MLRYPAWPPVSALLLGGSRLPVFYPYLRAQAYNCSRGWAWARNPLLPYSFVVSCLLRVPGSPETLQAGRIRLCVRSDCQNVSYIRRGK